MHFFPKADASLLWPLQDRLAQTTRPETIGPIFDTDDLDNPLEPWTQERQARFYPLSADPYAPSLVPDKPDTLDHRYLHAHLTKNERLRLSMLWYYTRGLDEEPEFLSRVQEKAHLAQESIGWRASIIGLLDINTYTRLATVGLELAILPRGETLCAHTVNHTPGNVFQLPSMPEDWRFETCPSVEHGAITAYAGVPLRMKHESGETVALGSLCLTSEESQEPLSRQEQNTLARLADWIVTDIVQSTRTRRQRERRRMAELVEESRLDTDDAQFQDPVMRILRSAYPDELISLQSSRAESLKTEWDCTISSSDLADELWEDSVYIDEFIANSNKEEPPMDRVVRAISAPCESHFGPSFIVVGTKNFKRIFDDNDAWFVQTCATLTTQRWQKRLLSEAMAAKEKLLRGVSHQLRTPIHGILGAAELFAEDLKMFTLAESVGSGSETTNDMKASADPQKWSTYLDTISTAGGELMSTVNSMIILNRWADIAAAERHNTLHRVSEIEQELAKHLSRITARDGRSRPSVFFHYDQLQPECGSIRTDLNLLRDSVLPLIINAMQNTPAGIVAVTISAKPESSMLVIDVEDTGCGIYLEDQERIFRLYEKVAEHSTGAGLGLTLATKFSALLHGSIELVSSEMNRGSHFRATFRDIDCIVSHPANTAVSKLKHIPLRFQPLVSDSVTKPLTTNLERFLTRNGFTCSENPNSCFLVLDYVADPKQRQTLFSTVSGEQVAICLIPGPEETILTKLPSNIVAVHGPFTSSTLNHALERLDGIIAAGDEARNDLSHGGGMSPKSEDEASPADVGSAERPHLDDKYSGSDEGYSSISHAFAEVNITGNCEHASDSDLHLITKHNDENDATVEPTASVYSQASKPMALLVDDNAVNLRILEMYCKNRGLPYLSAVNGQQAFEKFSEHQALSATGTGSPIELVLMDLQMPVRDGIEATKQIRLLEKQYGWKESVLFIVSGQDSQADREAASGAGAHDYLVKPVSMKLLDNDLERYFPDLKRG